MLNLATYQTNGGSQIEHVWHLMSSGKDQHTQSGNIPNKWGSQIEHVWHLMSSEKDQNAQSGNIPNKWG